MNPDPYLPQYKRMYRSGGDDKAVAFELYAEMKEEQPNISLLKTYKQRYV